MAESLAEFFLTHFGGHQHEPAFRQRRGYRWQRLTYGQVLKMAMRFAHELEARAIGKGDRVMLWGENCAQWVAAFFGCAICGAIVVPMDDGASVDFAQRVKKLVAAKLAVCSRQHAGKFGEDSAVLVLEELETTLAGHSTDALINAVNRGDTLQIVFTSGTTSDPKGVVITHENVLANIAPLEEKIRGYLKYERWVHPLRFLNLLPLSHVFGQFLGMFLPPLLGGMVIFQDELKPSEIVQTIRREKVSVLVSVPRVLQSLKQKIEHDLEDRGGMENFRKKFARAEGEHFLKRWWIFRKIHSQFGWKFWAFISGGAALDRETEEFWGRLGYAAIQGYVLTETTSLISVNHPFKLGKGSIGKVLPGREIKLAEDGEILVRGGGVSSGYWRGESRTGGPEADQSARISHRISDEEGWYCTGDIGALDDAGNLYFKGRKKEVIVTPAGLNIYPDDLEAALRREPAVKDCVVVGIEREGNAEPCAVVILRGEGSLEEVVQHANQTLAEFQRMRLWVKWPEEDFPRTNTQKPRRNLIREAAQRELKPTAGTPSESSEASPLVELIARVSRRAVPGLRADAALDSDLGLGSLDRVELMSAIEDRYQVDLSETGFNAARMVGDLEKILRGDEVARMKYHYPVWTLRWPATWARFVAHYLFLHPAILLLGWPRIEGRENLRGVNGPLLVVCNHVDDVDVGFILTALPARLRHSLATAAGGEALEALRTPAANRNFFLKIYDRGEWFFGVLLLNLFPLPRAAGFRQSFAYAGQAVDCGYSVLVFPEGRHTTDGKINPFRAGVGLLAENLAISVLPMRIDGLFELKKTGRRFARPWQIQVKIGKPVRFDPGTKPEAIAQTLQQAVEDL